MKKLKRGQVNAIRKAQKAMYKVKTILDTIGIYDDTEEEDPRIEDAWYDINDAEIKMQDILRYYNEPDKVTEDAYRECLQMLRDSVVEKFDYNI